MTHDRRECDIVVWLASGSSTDTNNNNKNSKCNE